MSNELISILIALAAVGVALAGLILDSNRGLRQDMAKMEGRLKGKSTACVERSTACAKRSLG